MSTFERILQDLNEAIRIPDRKHEVELLRMAKAAFKNAEIAKRSKAGLDATLTDEEVIGELGKMIKGLEESKILYNQGGRADLVSQTDEELVILRRYMPAQMGESAVKEIVERVVKGLPPDAPRDFGLVMKEVMKELKGKADGALISKLVKEILG